MKDAIAAPETQQLMPPALYFRAPSPQALRRHHKCVLPCCSSWVPTLAGPALALKICTSPEECKAAIAPPSSADPTDTAADSSDGSAEASAVPEVFVVWRESAWWLCRVCMVGPGRCGRCLSPEPIFCFDNLCTRALHGAKLCRESDPRPQDCDLCGVRMQRWKHGASRCMPAGQYPSRPQEPKQAFEDAGRERGFGLQLTETRTHWCGHPRLGQIAPISSTHVYCGAYQAHLGGLRGAETAAAATAARLHARPGQMPPETSQEAEDHLRTAACSQGSRSTLSPISYPGNRLLDLELTPNKTCFLVLAWGIYNQPRYLCCWGRPVWSILQSCCMLRISQAVYQSRSKCADHSSGPLRACPWIAWTYSTTYLPEPSRCRGTQFPIHLQSCWLQNRCHCHFDSPCLRAWAAWFRLAAAHGLVGLDLAGPAHMGVVSMLVCVPRGYLSLYTGKKWPRNASGMGSLISASSDACPGEACPWDACSAALD